MRLPPPLRENPPVEGRLADNPWGSVGVVSDKNVAYTLEGRLQYVHIIH